jgi:DNA invertase Pin-like site-specific DNA recombinase
MKKTAAIYVRVSTPDQHVESQLYDLRELAAQRGFEVVHEYEDRGVCRKKARRPGLDALMADARRKKFSVVLVAAFDRIARSTRNFLQVIDELDSMGIEFISRRENVDTSGPMGASFRDDHFGDRRTGKVTCGGPGQIGNAKGKT